MDFGGCLLFKICLILNCFCKNIIRWFCSENCFYEQECYINIKCGVDDCRKFKVYKLVGEQIVAIASQAYKR